MSYIDFVLPSEWADAITHGDYSALNAGAVYVLEDTLVYLGIDKYSNARIGSHTFYTAKHDAAGVPPTECVIISFVL